MAKEMPEVTDEERSAIHREVAERVDSALVARGLGEAERKAAIARAHDRIVVVPRFGGPETRVKIAGGAMPFGVASLRRLVDELAAEAQIASLGPDPIDLVADQVVFATHADRAEVLELIRGKARRLADGSIVVRLPTSRPRDPLNPGANAPAEIRGNAGIDALARWAAAQLRQSVSKEALDAKRAGGAYGL